MPRVEASPFSRVNPGDKFRFPAALYDTLVDVAREHQRGVLPGRERNQSTPETETVILVSAYAPLPRFGVVQLDGSALLRSVNKNQYATRRVYDTIAPAVGAGTIAIVQEPAAFVGAVVPAVLIGETACQIDLVDVTHQYAKPSAANDRLVSDAAGIFRITHLELGTVGLQWGRGILPGVRAGEIGGNSGLLFPSQETVGGGASPVWEEFSHPQIPTISEKGSYILSIWYDVQGGNVLETNYSCDMTLDDPAGYAFVYGSGFVNGLPHPEFDKTYGGGWAVEIAQDLIPGTHTRHKIGEIHWHINVVRVPYTPVLLARAPGGQVVFGVEGYVITTFPYVVSGGRGCWYSLIRTGGGGSGTGTLDGAGSVPGGGTGRSSFGSGNLIGGNGSGPLQDVTGLSGGAF